jgi:hypothetical protein
VLLVTVENDFRWFPYAVLLLARTSFELASICCISSSDGWLALSFVRYHNLNVFILLNPINVVEVVLPLLTHKKGLWVMKVVFLSTVQTGYPYIQASCQGKL